jgi:anti-anti-sigma factor
MEEGAISAVGTTDADGTWPVGLVSLKGDLDLSTSAEVERRIRGQEKRRVEILVLDLRELSFLDSTGLRLIMSAAGRASVGGWRLVLVRGPESIQRVFRITKLDGELEFVDDPAELS